MSDTMSQPKCELCGEPMPTGEEMFKYHGYSGPCPKPPAAATPAPEGLDDKYLRILRRIDDILAANGIDLSKHGTAQGVEALAALRARPVLSDETLREMAEAAALRVVQCDPEFAYEGPLETQIEALVAFARAVLACQQEGK